MYGVHPSDILRMILHFSQYNEDRLHKLRIMFLQKCEEKDYTFNDLSVKGFIINNLDGGFKYGINFYDKARDRRINIYGPLKGHHYNYLKRKSFYGGKPLDNLMML